MIALGLVGWIMDGGLLDLISHSACVGANHTLLRVCRNYLGRSNNMAYMDLVSQLGFALFAFPRRYPVATFRGPSPIRASEWHIGFSCSMIVTSLMRSCGDEYRTVLSVTETWAPIHDVSHDMVRRGRETARGQSTLTVPLFRGMLMNLQGVYGRNGWEGLYISSALVNAYDAIYIYDPRTYA